MTIEKTLERIANALETIAFYKTAPAEQRATANPALVAHDYVQSAAALTDAPKAEGVPASTVPEPPAAVGAEANTAAEPVTATEVVRKRGRPRKDEAKKEELVAKDATLPPADDAPPAAPVDVKVLKDLVLTLIGKVGRGPVAAVFAADPFRSSNISGVPEHLHGKLFDALKALENEGAE